MIQTSNIDARIGNLVSQGVSLEDAKEAVIAMLLLAESKEFGGEEIEGDWES